MWAVVVLANCLKRSKRKLGDRHCDKGRFVKPILTVITIVGLSLIAAATQGGGTMIGALATNIAAYFVVGAVRG